jgi:hypothetical protein
MFNQASKAQQNLSYSFSFKTGVFLSLTWTILPASTQNAVAGTIQSNRCVAVDVFITAVDNAANKTLVCESSRTGPFKYSDS